MPGEDSGGGGAEVPRVATAPLEQQREEQPVGIDPETTITAVKTAAELAAERKREKQLEEERMIRLVTCAERDFGRTWSIAEVVVILAEKDYSRLRL